MQIALLFMIIESFSIVHEHDREHDHDKLAKLGKNFVIVVY